MSAVPKPVFHETTSGAYVNRLTDLCDSCSSSVAQQAQWWFITLTGSAITSSAAARMRFREAFEAAQKSCRAKHGRQVRR